ncbi:hypothetical protein [Streptomyces geranii]|uniref:hypothetical protein n=1 Tax=Streptomyces geranii TaxID=2058923 RepID=UPI001300A449|nr:hypothetical protein [Streptomyces geranii]
MLQYIEPGEEPVGGLGELGVPDAVVELTVREVGARHGRRAAAGSSCWLLAHR